MSCPEGLFNIGEAKPGDTGVSGTTSTSEGKCCWCEDYAQEIKTNEIGTYHDYYRDIGKKTPYGSHGQKYKLYCALKSGKVIVEMRFSASGDAAMKKFGVLKQAVASYWSNKAKLVIDDPECGIKKLPITFSVIIGSNPHRTLEIVPDAITANARGSKIQVNSGSKAWALAHEFGHAFGNPDEYITSPDPAKADKFLVYYAPDGSNSGYIKLVPNGGRGSTIMANFGNSTLLERNFWCVAIEAQKLLRNALGRSVKCSVDI